MLCAEHARAFRRPPATVAARAAWTCAAFLGFWVGVAPAATPAWIEVLRDDDSGMELRLRAPELQRLEGRPMLPGLARGGEPGLPTLFEASVLIAVPGGAGARLEVLESETRRESGLRPEFVPEPLSYAEAEDDAGLATPRVHPRAWRGTYPENVLSLHGTGRLRGRDAVSLRFVPLQYAADGSMLYTRSARVRITFANRARVTSALASEPLHGALLNASTASRWRLRFDRQASTRSGARVAALPNERLRVRIPRTGIYELSYQSLNVAGVPVGAIDPTEFQLFTDTWHPVSLFADSVPASWQADYALQELAIWVEGEEDHVFEQDDRIVFYALGPYEYLDRVDSTAGSLAHAQNPYDNFNYVWLVWGQAPGLRVAEAMVTESDTSGVLTRSEQRYHLEEDNLFRRVDNLWIWEELRDTRPALVNFDLDLGADPEPVAGTLRIGISHDGNLGTSTHGLKVHFNGQEVGRIDWVQPTTSKPPNAYFSFAVLFRPSNHLRLEIDTTQQPVSPRTYFLSLDVMWPRRLAVPGPGTPDADFLRWSAQPSTPDEAYELAGFGPTAPLIFDVTDPRRPVRLRNPSAVGPPDGSRRWRLRYGRGAGVRVRYAAVRTPAVLAGGELALRLLPPLRDPMRSVPDMLIVTHPTLRAQAERLAAHRAAHYPDELAAPSIEVVDVTDVYDHFSGGRVDPLAIRNYAKFLYTLGDSLQQPNLRYLMLFGEATHDPRRLLPSTTPTLVPTVQAWYSMPATKRQYAVDDWLAEFDAPDPNRSVLFVSPLPDLALGRITPRTSLEARGIVDKFIAYDTSTEYGPWRTRVILAADDEVGTLSSRETFHIDPSEGLVGLTPDEWDIVKMYLTEFPLEFGFKPSARRAFIRDWSDGCALINYLGHGAPRTLADEHLFLGVDVPSLSNGRRLPMFTAFSCTVAEFDAPELQSMAEDMLTHAAGGAVAAMGATDPTFATPNEGYNRQIWQDMFTDGATSKVPFGVMHMLGKNSRPSTNNEKYVFLGDPAMTLLSPEYTIDLSSGTDSLQAGATSTVQGFVRSQADPGLPANFNGLAEVEVFSSADESGYTRASDGFHIDYELRGDPVYRGTVQVVDGRFQFGFVVPLDARQGNKARVAAYAWNPDMNQDAKGGINGVRLVRAAEPQASRGVPRITMRFPNNITKVQPGTPLIAQIVDENGINIQGTTLKSSISLDFDASGQKLDVTSRFRYDGSDTLGTVSVPLPELSPGRHKAELIAYDNVQERGSASISFDVVAPQSQQLVNVIAFPNPFRDQTHFFFEVTSASDVTVRVYTSSGREVWRGTTYVAEPRQAMIPWRGVDRGHDELANGTYLYRVEARPRQGEAALEGQQGPILNFTGKVVIMRD